MTVSTDNTSTKTTADGVEVTFTFGFQTQTSLWVKAQTTDPGGTPVDRLDITTVINEDQENNPGGSVTFDTAPAVGALVNLYRDTPQTQLTDYTDYSAFPAESTENALDKLTFITQEIETPGTAPSECDGFLPLAGGVMEFGADIQWDNPSVPGNSSFKTLFGQPSFLWAPIDTVEDEIGYSWGAAQGKTLSYNLDGRFSLVLTGRTIPLASLEDDDLVTKANLDEAGLSSDPVYNSVTWNHQTDEPSFGSILTGYAAGTLGGFGGQVFTLQPTIDTFYQGYKFITGTTLGPKFVDVANGSVWLGTAQTEGGSNDPLANTLITRSWGEANLGGATVWGTITGTLSNQADLQSALNGKADNNDLPAGWQIAKASGGWLSNGSNQGTQRGCSVTRIALGQYRITLNTPLTSQQNCTVNVDVFGVLAAVSAVFSVTSTTTIQVNTVLSNTSAAVDAGATFNIVDRGLS